MDYIDCERKLKKWRSTMRVSRDQAEKNRQTVINVASQLFREHGFDGIGLKDLMEAAGLTQGAFYKQFASKDDLAARASKRALESISGQWSAAIESNPEDPLGAVVARYLSMGHREQRGAGCPLPALAADAGRQGADVKASFEAGIGKYLETLEGWVEPAAKPPPTEPWPLCRPWSERSCCRARSMTSGWRSVCCKRRPRA